MKKIFFILLLAPFYSPGQIIQTIAGTGSAISGGDGGPATAAGINGPGGVGIDVAGNLYIDEYYNHTIRKVSPSGMISTIAGNGSLGYSGDGGPATNAQLSRPSKIAIDNLRNLYFADLDNNCVRKISTTGIITTVAGNGLGGYSGDGGLAVLARLFFPTGVSLDGSGNLYVADYGNSVIRKVTVTGMISTVAGTGVAGSSGDGGMATAARLNQPWGANADASGNLYISDMVNHKIRKVSPSGIITTFAGTGAPGFSGDGGPATAAMLYQPSAVAFDLTGNIYISDELNNRIRKISSTGIITTVAGNGLATFGGDGGPATAASINSSNDITFDTSWHLIICDNANKRIRILADCAGSITTQPMHDTVPEGTNAVYTVITAMPFPVYQWQEDPGSGFVNLANVWPYSGVTTNNLTIHNTSIFLNTTHYRCIITNSSFCTDTSASAILIVQRTTSLQQLSANLITIYPNPAHDKIMIDLPGQNNKANIQLINALGQVVSDQKTINDSNFFSIADLPTGMYIVRIQCGLQLFNKRIFKN